MYGKGVLCLAKVLLPKEKTVGIEGREIEWSTVLSAICHQAVRKVGWGTREYKGRTRVAISQPRISIISDNIK